MGKIRILDEAVANQVAAGEIVDRPASVVKELVENSIDAGAKKITVEIQKGGTQLIRVSDDGCGMSREDAILSLERHATSKIKSAEDLASVTTMGFRGEAIPSIASVSQFKMSTKTKDDSLGTEIVINGGKPEIRDTGEATGTVIEVKSLFFNIPARRKFLRGDSTEAAHIVHLMEGLAIAHPTVSFILIKDGKQVWQAAATTNDSIRLRDIFGSDFTRRLIRVEAAEVNDIIISGHIAKIGEGRPDREQQFIVLNRRVVQCQDIYKPLKEAYAELMPKGRNPLAVLHIKMNPLSFDCNVHPAKREVRLHKPDLLKQAVFEIVQAALEHEYTPDTPKTSNSQPTAIPYIPYTTQPANPRLPLAQEVPILTSKVTDQGNTVGNEPEETYISPVCKITPPAVQFIKDTQSELLEIQKEKEYEILAGLHNKWLILESKEGLVLLDIKGATERILFETLKRESDTGCIKMQKLLIPEVLSLPAKDISWITENNQSLVKAGFAIEAFGENTVKLDAIPACLPQLDSRNTILEVCNTLKASGTFNNSDLVVQAIIRSVTALAKPDVTQTAPQLLERLLKCDQPYASPKGNPTMIQWSFFELERKFHRK